MYNLNMWNSDGNAYRLEYRILTHGTRTRPSRKMGKDLPQTKAKTNMQWDPQRPPAKAKAKPNSLVQQRQQLQKTFCVTKYLNVKCASD